MESIATEHSPKPKKLSKILELVSFAKSDTENIYKDVILGKIPNFQAQEINKNTGVRVNEATKVITAHAIRHILKGHTNIINENKRGQVSITDKDFELITDILNMPDTVIKGENSSRRNKALIFLKKINGKTYHVIMSLEPGNNSLVLNTMYIKK